MRVLVLGGSGVIGRQLIPALAAAGHQVVATARSAASRRVIEELGAEPVEADGLDLDQILSVVAASNADALINQMTCLPDSLSNPIDNLRSAAANNRLRGEVGPAVTGAAVDSGITRIVSQSVAFACPPTASVLQGDEPLWVEAGGPFGKANKALTALEAATTDANGTVLRYGALYGPGTYYGPEGAFTQMIRKRRFPLIGDGRGAFGFIHLSDAVSATLAALTSEPGTYSVVDDEAVPAATWTAAASAALGSETATATPEVGCYGTALGASLHDR